MDGLEDEEWEDEDLEILENNSPFTEGYMEKEYDEFDLNKDGILDAEELRAKEDAMLKDPAVSAWRKNLILKKRRNSGDDLTKTY